MTINTQKIVIVLGGPTGPTGTFEGVNILGTFTGRTGQFPQWAQATGNTGPHGTFKSVYNIGPTGVKGEIKTVIIPGFSSNVIPPPGLGSAFNVGGVLSHMVRANNNQTVSDDLTGASNGGAGGLLADDKSSGKFYIEYTVNHTRGTSEIIGLKGATFILSSYVTDGSTGFGVFLSNGQIMSNGSLVATLEAAIADGNVIAYAIDLTAKLVWVKNITKAGNWNANPAADPATGVGGVALLTSGSYNIATGFASEPAGAPAYSITVNCGGRAQIGAAPSGFGIWAHA